ncbi:hypothetical protein B2G51_09600 [Leptospira santarosai]|nr:hypothetical protein B2G51_09600 [Leptospira santarosai]
MREVDVGPGSSTSIRKPTGNLSILSKRVASQYFYYDPFDKPLSFGSKIQISSRIKTLRMFKTSVR